jgi:hypothetical protein
MGNEILEKPEIEAIIDSTSATIQIPDNMFTTIMQYEEKLLQDEFTFVKNNGLN